MSRILVIDDDPTIAELLGSVLSDGGHDSSIVGALPPSGDPHSADLVITDLVPLSDYRSAAAHEWVSLVMRRFPDTPVIVLTAHGAAAREPDELGAAAVMSKPFDVDRLLDTVERVLAERRST